MKLLMIMISDECQVPYKDRWQVALDKSYHIQRQSCCALLSQQFSLVLVANQPWAKSMASFEMERAPSMVAAQDPGHYQVWVSSLDQRSVPHKLSFASTKSINQSFEGN